MSETRAVRIERVFDSLPSGWRRWAKWRIAKAVSDAISDDAALAELREVAERMATYLRECLGCNACKGCVEEECGIHEDLDAFDAWKKANP